MATRSDERARFLRARFLSDIITTAVEGGTGYWAQVSQYQYVDDMETPPVVRICVGRREGDETRAVLHPLRDDDSGYEQEGKVITPDVIATGISRIVSGEVEVRSDLKRWITEGARDNEGGMIDAEAADVIVQAGIFGEVIYG
jgi:hypothetical protein